MALTPGPLYEDLMGKEQNRTNEIAARLALTRRALGYDRQTEFVEALSTVLEVTPQRWNNYESGRDRVTVAIALALCARFDLSLDWIYRGKRGELPARILRAIEDIEALDQRRRKLRDEI
jgi:transcriptional regulator with XRE-family HTH domain